MPVEQHPSGWVYEIVEHGTAPDGKLFLLVEFWRTATDTGQAPWLTEEFGMELKAERLWPVMDGRGHWLHKDGQYVDVSVMEHEDVLAQEWVQELVPTDLKSEVNRNISNYIDNAIKCKWSGDHTSDSTKPLYEDGKRQRKGGPKRLDWDAADRGGLLARLQEQGVITAVIQ